MDRSVMISDGLQLVEPVAKWQEKLTLHQIIEL